MTCDNAPVTFDLAAAVGQILVGRGTDGDDKAPRFAGTCFLFRSDSFALTAAHCVPEGWAVECLFPRMGRSMSVRQIHRHPRADLAALELDGDFEDVTHISRSRKEGVKPVYGFWGLAAWHIGTDAWAYGFPTEASARGGEIPTNRLFKGHVQTAYRHEDAFNYFALELSFPAPAGLSGGPVGPPHLDEHVYRLVTMNHDSYRVEEAVEEVIDEGKHLRVEARRIISYGLALALDQVTDWIDEVVPKPINPYYS
jgi:hypothetical protein